jgi:MSHA biogenesis protein MshP
MKPIQNAQHGFAAIAAVFLVLILAAFGAFMVSFSNTQQLNSAQDLQGSRAYWAARAGLEWAIVSVGASACWATTPPATIDGFNMAISCSVLSYTEGVSAGPVLIFRLESVASTGTVGSLGFIERSVSASLER